MVKDPNQKHYFEECTIKEIKEVFYSAAHKKFNFRCWEQGKGEEQVEEFELIHFDEASMIIGLKPKGNLITKIIGSKLNDQKIHFHLAYQKLQYFSSGKLLYDAMENLYYIYIKEKVFKGQQRQNYRLSTNLIIKIGLLIDNQKYQGIDISAGGASIKITGDHPFKKGQIIENVILFFMLTKYLIPEVKVANIEEHHAHENLLEYTKIGFSFHKLSVATEEKLFKAINSEARAEELRKSLLNKK